ncbi:HAMP domain-containing sensor histidine kinase [Clostridium sediminicola]|uniref:sensor histidine kinase n=1 Tax=Clostridium sediminicola TaxID=3114879 RepID=UPI0031F27EB1
MEIKTKKRTMTLKSVFLKYIMALGISFILVFIVGMAIIEASMKIAFCTPANYSENLARQVKPILVSSPEISNSMIPKGCKYVVFDKEFNIVNNNMDTKELKEATEYAKGLTTQGTGTKKYYFIEREDGLCVLQYYMEMRYSDEWLNNHFPKPEMCIIILIIIGCLLASFVIAIFFAKNLKEHLKPLMNATEKIKEQDLSFDVENSKIKEFNDVLSSISDMKLALKNSLEQQWNLEQTKREQISSLAHDIKTPLTIIKGNAELLEDSYLDEEQQIYIKFIKKNTNQIVKYVKMLIDASKAESKVSIKLNKVNTNEFTEDIFNQLKALTVPKEIKVKFLKKNLPKEIIIDRELLFRALMNVIINAVEHTSKGNSIEVYVIGNDTSIIFKIIDSGKGFSGENLKFATKQFYMGDSSRMSKTHYGMGLYIVKSITELHKGKLYIENSCELGGGKVSISVPINEG